MTAGELIKSQRVARGETMARFAERLGVSAPHISELEHGHKGLGLGRAWRWAKILGVDRLELVRLVLQQSLDDAGIALVVKVRRR